jgi:hypothetical protein
VYNILNFKNISDHKIILFICYLFIFNIIQIVRHWYHRPTMSYSIAVASVEDVTSVEGVVISRSEIAGTKSPYVCPGCFIHTYSNNMINRFHVQ